MDIALYATYRAIVDVPLQHPAYGIGQLYHIWCYERGDDTYRHYYRIEFAACYAKLLTKHGQYEGKLAYLHHGKTAMNTIAQRTSRKEIRQCAYYHLTEHYTYSQHKYHWPIG